MSEYVNVCALNGCRQMETFKDHRLRHGTQPFIKGSVKLLRSLTKTVSKTRTPPTRYLPVNYDLPL